MVADVVDEPLPGHVIAVRFENDHWWHERLLVWPVTTCAWCIYSPDGDFYTAPSMVWEEVIFLERAGVRPPPLRGANCLRAQPGLQPGGAERPGEVRTQRGRLGRGTAGRPRIAGADPPGRA
eukprot:7910627-Heterocapsa_arctica.AAC.1